MTTTFTPRVVSVRVPPGERRNPIAMVRMELGPFFLSLGVSRLKKSGLIVRLPMGEGGEPALEVDAETWPLVEQAAIAGVMADQVAREHVLGRDLRKMGL